MFSVDHIQNIAKALRATQKFARAAKILQVAYIAALGGAVASLAIGGIRLVKKFR